MSVQVTQAMIDMFSANVLHLAQQKESRLRQYCRQETQVGEKKGYDRIGLKTAQKKTGRHSDVNYQDTPHSRRWVTTEFYYDADLVDDEDKQKVIMNLESEYLQAIGYALGRATDEEIILGALGTAYTGRNGTGTATLPNTQKVAAFDGTTTTGVGLNVSTLRAVRKKFKKNEVIKENEKLTFVHAAQQADDLLGQTQATSSDYAAIKALVDGEVNYFMGFIFVHTELLPFTATDTTYTVTTGAVGAGTGTVTAGEGRRCFAFTPNRGVLCAMTKEVNGKLDVIPTKHHAMQCYGSLSVGAVRMDEVEVVEVICKEV